MTEPKNAQTQGALPFYERDDVAAEATVVLERENLRVISYRPPTRRDSWARDPAARPAAEVPLPAETSILGRLQPAATTREQRFEKLALLGEGSTARVYAVRDANCNREIAIKIPKQPHLDRHPQELSNFVTEAGIAARLQHPNIIPVYDLNMDADGNVYMAMRKVEGRTLRDYVADLRESGGHPAGDSLNELIQIFLKICDALAFAHNEGLVHQDVKPENIALGTYGEVFVLDWGASATCSDELALTPAYMSPQQAQAQSPTPADDIYCVGATLFHCLLLRLPTDAPTLAELVRKKRAGTIDVPTADERRRVPPQLIDIALKAMAAKPEDRYPDIASLAEDLRHYQEGLAVSAHRESILGFFRRWYRHNRRQFWAAAVIAAVGLVAAVLVITEIGKRREAERRRQRAEQEQAEMQAKLTPDWRVVYDADFSRGRPADFPFDAYLYNHSTDTTGPTEFERIAAFADGCLRLTPLAQRQYLEFNRDIPEESKVEVVVTNPGRGGLNLGLSISGDANSGHRLRLYGYHHIELESERRGFWEVLYHCDYKFDPKATTYRIAFWRVGNTFHAAVNDEQIMNYIDPVASRGPRHRTLAVSRYSLPGHSQIRRLTISKWRDPEFVDILEPGRVLLRKGHWDEAREWFADVMREDRYPSLRDEARYLHAMAIDERQEPQRKAAALRRLGADPSFRFRREALVLLALLLTQEGDYVSAVTATGEALRAGADPGLPRRITMAMGPRMKTLPPAQRESILQEFGRTPIDALDVSGWRVASLAPLQKLRLKELKVAYGQIDSLAPLTGMPLESLYCPHNRITDVKPLRGMPLQQLDINSNRLADIAPLRDLPLQQLNVSDNRITDLSPVTGLPLRRLSCGNNPLRRLPAAAGMTNLRQLYCENSGLRSLAPLRGARLTNLGCSNNPVQSLAPLAGMPLQTLRVENCDISDLAPLRASPVTMLFCSNNDIIDLEPLRGRPLRTLNVARNRVVDLSPLAACPLEELWCSHNRIESLAPLSTAKLKVLSCSDNQIADLSPLRETSLRRLYCGGNRIADLSPLKDLPLRELQCGNNPITDFSSLANRRFRKLGISGIPLSAAARRDLATVAVDNLLVSLNRADHVDLVRQQTGLQFINDHRAKRVRPLLPAVHRALAGKTAPLRRQAVKAGERFYLVVPELLPRAAAKALAGRAGARLAEPRTPEQWQALSGHITGYAVGSYIRYHLGAGRSPETGNAVWDSDQTAVGKALPDDTRLTADRPFLSAREYCRRFDHGISAETEAFPILEWIE